MRDRRERERRRESEVPVKTRSPDIEELSTEKIKGQIRNDAIQHPMTSFPIVIAILAVIYLFFVAPFVGGGLAAFFIAVGAGIVGVLSGGWRWLIRGRSYIEKKTQELADLQERTRKDLIVRELDHKRYELEDGFTIIKFAEGQKELRELVEAYAGLITFLSRTRESNLISKANVASWATETYKQGLSVLSDALEIMRAVGSANIEGLEAEVRDLERQIESLERRGSQEEKIKVKRMTIESHMQRIAKAKERELNVVKLLAQSNECEAALSKTRLDMSGLSVDSSEEKAKEVSERLRHVIETALAIQEALKKSEGIDA